MLSHTLSLLTLTIDRLYLQFMNFEISYSLISNIFSACHFEYSASGSVCLFSRLHCIFMTVFYDDDYDNDH